MTTRIESLNAKVLEFVRRAVQTSATGSNQWITNSVASVYLRVSFRLIGHERVRALDIANITVSDTGKGTFSNCLPVWETVARNNGLSGVYVENVLEERLGLFLSRRGYSVVNTDGVSQSFYKSTCLAWK